MTDIIDASALTMELRRVDELLPHPNNPREHTPKQVRQIADAYDRFGCIVPILINNDNRILAGHARWAAAKLRGMVNVPTICIGHLSPAEQRAFIIADNRLGDLSRFDRKRLAKEAVLILEDDPTFDLETTGFDAGELEIMIDVGGRRTERVLSLPPPERDKPALVRPGDLWMLGRHRLFCGDSLKRESFIKLMARERARVIFGDAPYNVPASSISGKGKVAHGDSCPLPASLP